MKSNQPQKLHLIVMPKLGGASYNVVLSRRFVIAMAAMAALLICSNLVVLYGYLNARSHIAQKERQNIDHRIAGLKNNARSLNQDLEQLRETSDRLDQKLDKYFSEKYMDDMPETRETPGPQSANPGMGQLQAVLTDMDKEISSRRTRLLMVEQRLDHVMGELNRIPEMMPVKDGEVSSGYGLRNHPISGYQEMHKGVDVAGAEGDRVYAAGKGKVKSVLWDGGLGLTVTMDHENGFVSRYAHLQKAVVHEGDVVDKGQHIAMIGKSGYAAGPALHFEILFQDKNLDPSQILDLTPQDLLNSPFAPGTNPAARTF